MPPFFETKTLPDRGGRHRSFSQNVRGARVFPVQRAAGSVSKLPRACDTGGHAAGPGATNGEVCSLTLHPGNVWDLSISVSFSANSFWAIWLTAGSFGVRAHTLRNATSIHTETTKASNRIYPNIQHSSDPPTPPLQRVPLPTHPSLFPLYSRYLLRSLAAARQGKRLSEAVSYLEDSSSSPQRPAVKGGSDLRCPATLLWLFRGRARGEVVSAEAAVKAEDGGGGGGGGKEAMVQAAVHLGR